jgi:hypothetical protein
MAQQEATTKKERERFQERYGALAGFVKRRKKTRIG